MRFNIYPILIAIAFTGVAIADPATPPSHPERDYVSIGGGLFLERDADFSPDDDGNIMVSVYSRHGISAHDPYTIDLSVVAGYPAGALAADAGTLGTLRFQSVTIDCTHQTYEVFDKRKRLPQPIWLTARTLPALAPLFRYVCKRSGKNTT